MYIGDGLVEKVLDGVRVEEIGLLWGNLRRRSRRAVARHVRRRYEFVDEEGSGGRRSGRVSDGRRGPVGICGICE